MNFGELASIKRNRLSQRSFKQIKLIVRNAPMEIKLDNKNCSILVGMFALFCAESFCGNFS